MTPWGIGWVKNHQSLSALECIDQYGLYTQIVVNCKDRHRREVDMPTTKDSLTIKPHKANQGRRAAL
jgi:hypothetical protein